mmetsp:Transcript_2701/g.8248  ORF Transcript_2701/g.8248 Transcript_2701/m.8248 type:complete len:206 (+) Transcript_2701:398-1015(+)
MLVLAISAGIPRSCALEAASAARGADSNFAKPPPIRGFGRKVMKPFCSTKKLWSALSSKPLSLAPTQATVSTCDGSSWCRGRLGGGWYTGGGGCTATLCPAAPPDRVMLLLAISAGMPRCCARAAACTANAGVWNFAKPPPILGLALKATKPGRPAKKPQSAASSMPRSVAPTEATVSTPPRGSAARGRFALLGGGTGCWAAAGG